MGAQSVSVVSSLIKAEDLIGGDVASAIMKSECLTDIGDATSVGDRVCVCVRARAHLFIWNAINMC